MAIRNNALIKLLKQFPDDATVCGFEEGITITSADKKGELVLLNDTFKLPRKTTFSKFSGSGDP
jgi:hypothetical protein